MKSKFKTFGATLLLVMICLLFTVCTPPGEGQRGNVLLINLYHEPIVRVIIGRMISDFNISQGDNVLLTVSLGNVYEIYVITKDLRVSNSIRVSVIDHMVETIMLNNDGTLINKMWSVD